MSVLELSPRGGTPLSKIFSMCGGSHLSDDDDNDEFDTTPYELSGENVMPSLCVFRSIW